VNAGSPLAGSATRASPALRLIRELGVGALAGAAAGALVAGFGSRIAMRISGFAAGPEKIGQATENGNLVGQVTVGGTLELVLSGIVAGAFGGIVYVALRPWVAGLGRWRGLGFGLLLLAATGSGILDPGNADFRRFGPPLLNVAMFAALFPLGGVVLAPLAAALERYAPADPERPLGGRGAVDSLIWIAGIGALLFLGSLVVGTFIGTFSALAAGRGGEAGAVPALVLVAVLALTLGTRLYLAYAGDRSTVGGRLRAASTVVLAAVVVVGLARTVSGIGEIVR